MKYDYGVDPYQLPLDQLDKLIKELRHVRSVREQASETFNEITEAIYKMAELGYQVVQSYDSELIQINPMRMGWIRKEEEEDA